MTGGPIADIEILKKILADPRSWIQIGSIEQIEPSPDFSVLRVLVKTLPEETEISVRMAWSMIGTRFPLIGELVLVAFVDGEEDEAYAFARLSSSDERIPLRAMDGSLCVHHTGGGKVNIFSDDAVNIGRGLIVEESEPLVLGNVLKDALNTFMATVDDHFSTMKTHLGDLKSGPIGQGNMGYPVPTHPTLTNKITATEAVITAARSQLALDIAKFLTVIATNILSQIAFTER